jgi:hypothetical protein
MSHPDTGVMPRVSATVRRSVLSLAVLSLVVGVVTMAPSHADATTALPELVTDTSGQTGATCAPVAQSKPVTIDLYGCGTSVFIATHGVDEYESLNWSSWSATSANASGKWVGPSTKDRVPIILRAYAPATYVDGTFFTQLKVTVTVAHYAGPRTYIMSLLPTAQGALNRSPLVWSLEKQVATPSTTCESSSDIAAHDLTFVTKGNDIGVNFWRTKEDQDLGVTHYKVSIGQVVSPHPNPPEVPLKTFGTVCETWHPKKSDLTTGWFESFPKLVANCGSSTVACQKFDIDSSFQNVPNLANIAYVAGFNAKGKAVVFFFGLFPANYGAQEQKILSVPIGVNEGQFCNFTAVAVPVLQVVYTTANLGLSVGSLFKDTPFGEMANTGSSIVDWVSAANHVNGDGEVEVTTKQKIVLDGVTALGEATSAFRDKLVKAVTAETGTAPSYLHITARQGKAFTVITKLPETFEAAESFLHTALSLKSNIDQLKSTCTSLGR